MTVSTNIDRVAKGRPYVFVRSVVPNEQGIDVTFRSSWGDGRFTLLSARRFQCRQCDDGARVAAQHGVPLDAACDVLSTVRGTAGTHAARRRRTRPSSLCGLRTHASSHRSRSACAAAHCEGRALVRVRLRRRSRCGQTSLDGRAAERLADRVVITSDNPRSEDPKQIIEGDCRGTRAARIATIIEDRAAAIAWTIELRRAATIVLLAGKGHENYQLIGDERRDFSDYGVAAAAGGAQRGGGQMIV